MWRERTGVQRIEEKMQRRRRRRRRRGRGGEEREKRKRRVCELVRNSVVKPSIYRRMERKKKTMKEIKKEKGGEVEIEWKI